MYHGFFHFSYRSFWNLIWITLRWTYLYKSWLNKSVFYREMKWLHQRYQEEYHKWPDCFFWSFPWPWQCVKRHCLFKASTVILLLNIVLKFSEILVSLNAAPTWDSSLLTVTDEGACLLVDEGSLALCSASSPSQSQTLTTNRSHNLQKSSLGTEVHKHFLGST